MEKRKIAKVLVWNFLCLLLFSGLALGNSVSVTIPDTTGASGESIIIPVLAFDIPADTVWSADMVISFDPAIVEAETVVFSGTLVYDWFNDFNILNDSIIIALAGSHTISGSGTLVYIGFKVHSSASPGDSSIIHFNKMIFNEGAPSTSVSDGVLRITSTGVFDDDNLTLPRDFNLGQNFPNPFNPTTTIPFSLKVHGLTLGGSILTSLTIYNILGQKVRILLNEDKIPGDYVITWDGKNDKGEDAPSGVYFYQLRYRNISETRKMILMR